MLVKANGFVASVWFPFFQSLTDAGTALAAAQTALTALQASVAADEAAIKVLQTAGGASVTSLTALEASLASLATLENALGVTQRAQTLELNTIETALEALNAQAVGDLTEATSDVLTIFGGTNAVLGAGASIQVKQASATEDGYLSKADYATFAAAAAFGIAVNGTLVYPAGSSIAIAVNGAAV